MIAVILTMNCRLIKSKKKKKKWIIKDMLLRLFETNCIELVIFTKCENWIIFQILRSSQLIC